MKPSSKLFFIVVLLFIISALNAKPLEKLSVKGKDIVTISGEVIRLKGVSFSDPDKLEKDGQWNKRYFKRQKTGVVTLCGLRSIQLP